MTELDKNILKLRQKMGLDTRIGYLGNGSGEVHDRRYPGRYYVRFSQAGGDYTAPVSIPANPNANLPTSDGLPIDVGYDASGAMIILRANVPGMMESGYNLTQLNPLDQQSNSFVNQTQITTFYATRHADLNNKPFTAVIFSGIFYVSGIPYFFQGNEIDLTSLQPSAGNHAYIGVFIKTDLSLEAFSSTAINTSDPLSIADIQEIVAAKSLDSYPVWAWEITGDDTELTVDPARQVDMRQIFGLDRPVQAHDVILPTVDSPTYTDAEDANTLAHSSGILDATITYITPVDSTHIDVAAGTGWIRTSNAAAGQLVFFDWPASSNIAIPAGSGGVDSVRYIGVEYNAGTPQVTVRTSFDWNWYDDFPLGRVSQDGTSLRILNAYAHAEDTANLTRRFMRLTMPFQREEPPEGSGGLVIADIATRYLGISSGNIWHGFNRYVIGTIDTSGADRFDLHYRNGTGGFTHVTTQQQWPNTQYDDGTGTLATMTNNRYACLWIYIDVSDGTTDMLYGRDEYVTQALAQAESPPATLPGHISAHGRLLGRFVFQKSASAAAAVDSIWSTEFTASGGGGASALDDLTDVTITSVAEDDILVRGASDWNNLNVAASRIVARLSTGHVIAATVAQIKTLLAIAVADISDIATTYIQKSIVGAKGDLIAATASATPDNLAVGSDGQVLIADSSASIGLSWQNSPAALVVTNSSGATANYGDVGYIDSDGSYKTTTTAGFVGAWCAVIVGGTNGNPVTVTRGGNITLNYAGSAPSAGNVLTTSTTAGKVAGSAAMNAGTMAVALAGGSGGTVAALLLCNQATVSAASAQWVYRIEGSSTFDFVSTISGSPSATSVVYGAVTSGNESCVGPYDTGQLAKAVLWNTTRGTGRLITANNTGTNTIATVSTVDAWANGDTITIESQTITTGQAWKARDMDLSQAIGSPFPLTARSVEVEMIAYDSTTAGTTWTRVHPYETYSDTKLHASYVQALSTNISLVISVPIISNRFGTTALFGGSTSGRMYLKLVGYTAAAP